jgi:hypothetical protein
MDYCLDDLTSKRVYVVSCPLARNISDWQNIGWLM